MNLIQIFKRVTKKLKTPEEIMKEMSEKAVQEQVGVSNADIQEIEDPLFTARINFETFKSIFKHDPEVSGSKSGTWDSEKLKITRLRETTSGVVSKSIDMIRIQDNLHNRKYKDMVNRAFGVMAESKNGYIYINYDIVAIEQKKKRE